MYRYQWVDSIVKISIILADKSGLRRKNKSVESQSVTHVDLGGKSMGEFMARFGIGTKKEESPIEKVRNEYNNYKLKK